MLYTALEQGYINVDNNFVSRKVFFERKRLEEKKKELEEIKKIKREKEEVDLEVFKERFTKKELKSIEEEAEKKYTPKSVFSKERHMEITMDEIIRTKFKDNEQIVDK